MVGGSHHVAGGRYSGARSEQESDLGVFRIELAMEVENGEREEIHRLLRGAEKLVDSENETNV